MAGTSIKGKDQKVVIGSANVLGTGNWAWSGAASQILDNTEFGDDYEKKCPNLITGGTITFAGNHKPGDITGQRALVAARDQGTNLTTLKFYVDNTSYYVACLTAQYLDPTNTTGMNTEVSHINVTSVDITADKGALGQISFTGEVSGTLVLV